jgi:hypothetical protein
MTIAYIDSTCLYQIVDVLSRSDPDKCYEWAWKTAIETSCALINSQNVRLAPSPTRDGPASGSFGELTLGLSEFVGIAESLPAVRTNAMEATKTWTRNNCDLLLRSHQELLQDQDNFAPWLDWALFNIWEEHSRRLNGLFDPIFIPEISEILAVTEDDLKATWEVSRDPQMAAAIARKGEGDSRFGMLRDGYIVSALIRGRYHDYVAQGNSWQIMHHPFRKGVFPEAAPEMRSEFYIANTELYFSNILMAAAFSESRSDRIGSWINNATTARRAVRAGAIDLRPKDNDDVALNVAVQAAKELDVRFHNRRVDQVLGAVTSLGLGSLISFTLNTWAGVIASVALTGAGLAAKELTKGKDPAARVVDVYTASDHRIRDLARAGPGRIHRNWHT